MVTQVTIHPMHLGIPTEQLVNCCTGYIVSLTHSNPITADDTGMRNLYWFLIPVSFNSTGNVSYRQMMYIKYSAIKFIVNLFNPIIT